MTRLEAEEKTMDTQETLPMIKASTKGELFLDYDDGAYTNVILMRHTKENDEWEQFGEYTDKGDRKSCVRTYRLDGDPRGYTSYAEFAAVYYAQYPERIEINRQKDIDRQKAQQ